MRIKRRSNAFEKLLLLVGFAIGVLGFYLLNIAFTVSGSLFNLDMLQAVFLWLLLIFMMILCAIAENQREELGIIIAEHVQETRLLKEEIKLLRDISNEHLDEVKLLRKDLGSRKKK
jgi:hypothetical protein